MAQHCMQYYATHSCGYAAAIVAQIAVLQHGCAMLRHATGSSIPAAILPGMVHLPCHGMAHAMGPYSPWA